MNKQYCKFMRVNCWIMPMCYVQENKQQGNALHNEELCDLYSSTNVIWVRKSRRMGWAGHAARMEVR
jgi:hypothetical protein